MEDVRVYIKHFRTQMQGKGMRGMRGMRGLLSPLPFSFFRLFWLVFTYDKATKNM